MDKRGQSRMPAQCPPLSNAVIERLLKSFFQWFKFTRQFCHYLLGRTVGTDHHSLTSLVNFRHPEGQIARWLEELMI